MEEIEVEPRPSSARRNFTSRNNAARQIAINFMPSRQKPYNTLRLRRNNSEHNALLDADEEAVDSVDAADRQADKIVREMEQHTQLMEDNPDAEELRREALRELPQCLTMKRNVRAKLSVSVSLRSKRRPISMMKRLKYRISFGWKRTKDRVRDLVFSIELWYEAIRNIEGHFGSAVGSYFYLLRWMFVLDLALLILLVAFLVIPQALHQSNHGGHKDRSFLDFVSGTGWLENSLLFYSYYSDGDILTGVFTYNMPFAYFFTMICLYVVMFAVLCFRTAYSYRRNFIDTAGGLSHVFANKVFCGWDFGIVSQHTAALTVNSIYNEFKELLYEQTRKPVKPSFCVKLGQYLVNILVTLIVLASIGAVELGLWYLLVLDSTIVRWELMISIVVTLVVTFYPMFFYLLNKLEFYKPRTSLYVTLARTWLLDVGTLILLFVYWSRSGVECWENRFGQEMYRLVLLDAVISLFLLPAVEFVRALIFKLNPKSSAPEFNIAYNSLTLIYNQAVLWFGMLFSPLLVVAVTVKLLLLFYVKRECALRACQPARKVWRAAQTQTVLYMLISLSLFATLFGVGSIFFKSSSQVCGPFQSYEYVYEVFTEDLLSLSENRTARRVLAFFTKPGFIGFVMLFLCVSVYYMRARALAQVSMVELLRHMLVLQAKDKDFLLNSITKVSNGEWMYCPKPTDEGPDTHTWKYLRDVRKPSNSGFNFDASRLSHGDTRRPLSTGDRISHHHSRNDGDTDSSFSWQGSNNNINRANQ